MTRSIGSPSDIETGADERVRRGRILVVGDPTAMTGLEEASNRPIVSVANLFDAVGELCTARPHEPIDALLVDAEHAMSATTRAMQSLRRFDPAVPIVLVSSGDGHATDGAFHEQFDAELKMPLTRRMIEGMFTAVEADQARDESRDESAAEIEIDRHALQQSHGANGSPASSPHNESNRRRDADQMTDQRADERRDEPLGDIDLVDAVMNDPKSVADCAVVLIQQQTGWSNVELLTRPTRRGIAVVHDGVFHGMLVVEDAPREQVEPWAEWLGYWMTLNAAYHRNHTLSLTDELTGAWNRRYFDSFLSECIRRAADRRRPLTLMVFDLDDFKQYNDRYGHAAGDEILRETVRLLTSVIRKGDRVCRIGGDEFAVIFADLEGPREPGSNHPQSVEQIAQRFQNEICKMHFPKLGIEAPGTLSVSAGLATYPWDGSDPVSLLEHADQLALESKRRGKNAITMGPGAQQNCCKH